MDSIPDRAVGSFAKRWRACHVLAAAMLLALLAGSAAAQVSQPNWPEYITIGTGSAGGTYHIYGQGLARILTRALGLQVLTRPTDGPAENIKLIEAGEIELGFVTLGVAQQAWTGSGEWTGGKQLRQMRALFPMYDTPFQFIVLSDSSALSVGDLAGRRVGLGPEGGTGGLYTPLIFKTTGTSAAFATGSWSEMAAGLAARRLDAVVAVGGVPLPEIADLERKASIRSLPLTPSQVVALRLAMPELSPSLIAAGTYPSVRRHYQTVGLYNFAVAHIRLPDGLVYAILDAVFTHQDEMLAAHAAAAETVPSNFTRNAILPFHAGAARWYNNKAASGVVRGD